MEKAKKLIKSIGDAIINEFDALDNEFNYEYDEDGLNNASYIVSFGYEYGDTVCDIDAGVYWGSNREADVEVMLYANDGKFGKQKKLDRLEEAVQDYVNANLDTDAMLEAMEEQLRDASMDEWERHGFRDAADYYHYRYG